MAANITENGTAANITGNGTAANITGNGLAANPTFDLFSLFNDDIVDMRNDGDAEPYRFGDYLVY